MCSSGLIFGGHGAPSEPSGFSAGSFVCVCAQCPVCVCRSSGSSVVLSLRRRWWALLTTSRGPGVGQLFVSTDTAALVLRPRPSPRDHCVVVCSCSVVSGRWLGRPSGIAVVSCCSPRGKPVPAALPRLPDPCSCPVRSLGHLPVPSHLSSCVPVGPVWAFCAACAALGFWDGRLGCPFFLGASQWAASDPADLRPSDLVSGSFLESVSSISAVLLGSPGICG